MRPSHWAALLVLAVSAVLALVACAPDRNSSAHDVHRFCTQKQYGVGNSFTAEKRYDLCILRYGRP